MAKHARKNNIILIIVRCILIIALIVSVIYITKWLIDREENKKISEQIAQTVIVENIVEDKENGGNTETKYQIDFEKLKEMNNQVVAFLKVPGTTVEYPVVQAKDNSYYLTRNLEKNYNVGGWIFADYKNKLDGTDKNIVIYRT